MDRDRNEQKSTPHNRSGVWLCYVGVVGKQQRSNETGERNETEQELKRESVHDGDRLKEDAAL